jgi:hypothetical protein
MIVIRQEKSWVHDHHHFVSVAEGGFGDAMFA